MGLPSPPAAGANLRSMTFPRSGSGRLPGGASRAWVRSVPVLVDPVRGAAPGAPRHVIIVMVRL